jgi:hypothetical protein
MCLTAFAAGGLFAIFGHPAAASREGREEWVAAYLHHLNLDHMIGWVRSKAAAC